MDAAGLVRELGISTGGTVVVKVGDQFYEVQNVHDSGDHVMITLGGTFLPNEGGGTSSDSAAPLVKDTVETSGEHVTPATGTTERDQQMVSGSPSSPPNSSSKSSPNSNE